MDEEFKERLFSEPMAMAFVGMRVGVDALGASIERLSDQELIDLGILKLESIMALLAIERKTIELADAIRQHRRLIARRLASYEGITG